MSRRTYEDVVQERRAEENKNNLEKIERNTNPPTDGSWIFAAIFGGIGSLFRPLRKLLPHNVNRVLDYASTIIALIGLIFAFTDGWHGFTTVGYSVLMFLVGVIGMFSSPSHDKKGS